MPMYLVAGRVPVLVQAVTNWDSTYTDYRAGEITFTASNLRAARKHVEELCAANKILDVYGLYSLRSGVTYPIPLIPHGKRALMLELLQGVQSFIPSNRPKPDLNALTDFELEALFEILDSAIWGAYQRAAEKNKTIESIIAVLKPQAKRVQVIRGYLKEIEDEPLVELLRSVTNWKKNAGKICMSATLERCLRPAVRKELFGE